MELPKHVIETKYGLRCRNCDGEVDEYGRWIDDGTHRHSEWDDECPDCGQRMRPIR